MRVGIVTRLADTLRQAMHVCLCGPEKRGQIACRIERILLGVMRHLLPVKPSHILSPTKHLPNKSLNRIERKIVCVVSRFDLFDHFRGREKATIKVKTDMTMKQPGLTVFHGVLKVAKVHQALFDKLCQHLKSLLSRYG